MTAYLHRTPGKTWTLTLVPRPCNGAEVLNGYMFVREGVQLCKSLTIADHPYVANVA